MGIFRRVMPIAVILAVLASILPPVVTPVFASSSHTWTTEADFEAGVLNNVDTSSSPGDVLLTTNLDTGSGAFDFLDVDHTEYTDYRRATVSFTSPAGQNRVYIGTPTEQFYATDEVLIIQMTGTGAGKRETRHVQSVEPTYLVLTENLINTYIANPGDAYNKAQVIMIPQWKDVTVKDGGRLTCNSWNGSTGGIVFFRSTGTVTIEQGGSIDVSGKGFPGGDGGTGGSGGNGGDGGNSTHDYDAGENGDISGTGGSGGSKVCCCGRGGDGALQGYNGNAGSSGSSGFGPTGGSPGHGGTNGSSNDLSLLQTGSGGGGGSGGQGGYGGGGQGSGGGGDISFGSDGGPGTSGGNGGTGGTGGTGAGAIIIFAKEIVVAGHIEATGASGSSGVTGDDGDNANNNWDVDQGEGGEGSFVCSGGGGGGGAGTQGGSGGTGGSGGSAGTIWLAADNLTLSNSRVSATGGAGGGCGFFGEGGTGMGYGIGGNMYALWCSGNDGDNGPDGPCGLSGSSGRKGGSGKIRLDYATLSGSTDPAPSYQSGVYVSSGTIASDVLDNGIADTPWQALQWQETIHNKTDISFEVRASNTAFNKEDATPDWISAGSSSPVTTGLPAGRYMQWRATLTTQNSLYTPVLHKVAIQYTNAPVTETGSATSISTTSAVLQGNLIAFNPAPNALVSFEYGTAPGSYSWETAPQQMNSPGAFQASLSGLLNATTYYYRAKAASTGWGTGYGEERHFTTATPSVIITNAASHVTASSACLNGTINYYPDDYMNIYFEWGTNPSNLNNQTPDQYNAQIYFSQTIHGLAVGTTYYYRAVGYDDYGSYSGSTMSFTTPGAAPSVSTGDATSITASSAMLNGALADLGSAGAVNVSFQYGTTQGGPYPNSTSSQAMTARGSFSAGITGLAADTTYYCRAKGDGGAYGAGYGNEISFTTSGIPPTVVTSGATGITSSSTTLNGQLTDMGSVATTNVSFEWGTDQDNLNMSTVPQSLAAPAGFNAGLSNLNPNTTYYFRARGDGGASGTGYGNIMSFTTATIPPSVSTKGATGVAADSATLNGTLHDLGSAPSVDVSFQYGTSSGMYSNQTTTQSMTAAGDFNAAIGGLSPATTYYYRAKARGNGASYGIEHVFTTGSLPPSVTTDNPTDLTTNSAMLNGNLTDLGTAATVNVSFQYGTSRGGPYPNSTSSLARTATGAFQISLSGLSSSATYFYRARADGGDYGTAYGAEKSFHTGMFPPYVETLPATGVTDTAANLHGNLHFLGSATTVNVSFQYGTTRGGPYPDSTTPQAMTATGAFQAPLAGLSSGTTYYFRTVGDGGTYGTGNGDEMSFTTSMFPPSVTTNTASAITSDSATLNGNLDALGDAATVNVSFQWGKRSGGPYPNSTPIQAMTATGAFQAGINGLHGDTTYFFRAIADGGTCGGAYGDELSFSTSEVPPSVETDNATSVAATTATLNGFLNSLGTADTVNAWFVWGVIQGGPYPNSTPLHAMSSRGFFEADISGLSPLTTYYFKAKADGGAHGAAEGNEYCFTTGATPPSVSTGGATGITADAATLNGTLHDLGTAPTVNVSFQYGTTSGKYNEETAAQSMAAPADFTANLASLRTNTTYYYRARANGGAHGASYGTEHAFTTGAVPPAATTAAATDKTTDSARLNGNLDALGTASTVNVSFVYGVTAGGPYPYSTSSQAMTATGAFYHFINGLSPFTTYYFKATADGGVYGTGYGTEMSFTTNHLPPVVETSGADDIMTNAATLNGKLYLLGTSPTVNVSFEWGATSGGPYPNTTPAQALTTPHTFLYDLTGLTPDTTYYFRSKADGGVHGTGYGEEQAFTTSSHPPIVATDTVSNLASTSATLNGDLLSLGSADTVNVSFEWGATHGGPYPNSTSATGMTTAGSFNSAISGLTPLTVYYFRAKSDGGVYGIDYGREMNFITATAPMVSTMDATSITASTARLNGDLISLGAAGTVNVSFLWGATSGGPYPNSTPPRAMSGPAYFWSDLDSLSSNTTYYFMAVADGGSAGIAYGNERSFITALTNASATTPTFFNSTPGGGSGQSPSNNTNPPPIQLSNVVVKSASLSAEKVAPGTPVEVTATLVNHGQVKGNASVRLYVNGQVDSVKGVTLESGKSRLITFTAIKDRPGTYSVYVDSYPVGSFTVEQTIDPNIVLYASLLMIIASLVLAVIYFRRRRQDVNPEG